MKKNPLIPMAAVTGDLSREEIHVILDRYAAKGISQILLYPRDGCDVPYMSERWLTIVGDFIAYAAEIGMDIWLYDEFNWPSGTCRGAVMAENEDFYCHHVTIREDGSAEIVKTEDYADILNPEAVDCFIRLTHEVYYQHFKEYFGTVVKGIFTDEPSFSYFSKGNDYPYTKNLEKDYKEATGRDLFYDMAHPDSDFLDVYYTLLGNRFRTAFADRICEWCRKHGILMTGHLLGENHLSGSVGFSGNELNVLRGFSLPALDEIKTETALFGTEWITLGVLEAAIRTKPNGGLAELFALGPTDLPPARIEQMIWLEAMFRIDHYLLAVSAVDARGNVKKNGWFNPMNYMNPWFEGYPELGESAALASDFAHKTIAAEVAVRIPFRAARRSGRNGLCEKDFVSSHLYQLLAALTKAQYQWILLDENETLETEIPVLTIENSKAYVPQEVVDAFVKTHPRKRRILNADGSCPDNLLLREFTDGSAVLLDLSDSDTPRRLIYAEDGKAELPFWLGGRSHLLFDTEKGFALPKEYETVTELSPVFQLSLDRPNTLRCNIRNDKTEFSFYAEEKTENVTVLIRQYCFDGQVFLDGNPLIADEKTNALTPGLSELYRAAKPFTLLPGLHTIRVSEPAVSEPFLPSCFLCGAFSSRFDPEKRLDLLSRLPSRVLSGRLDTGSGEILPQYAGSITLEAEVTIPLDAEALAIDPFGLYTRLTLCGQSLGGQISGFLYPVPASLRGKKGVLRIEQFSSIAPIFGRRNDVIALGDGETWTPLSRWFPGDYEACGVTGIRFVKSSRSCF